MDPTTTLANIRAIIKDLDCAMTESEVVELTDELVWMIRDLDTWITRGGFLPAEWQKARDNAQHAAHAADAADAADAANTA